MTKIARTALATDITSNIYTNTQRKIKGNTTRDRLINIIDSSLNIISDANVANGYMAISADGLVDVTFIKAETPTGKYLKDDGTWGFPSTSLAGTLQDVITNDPKVTGRVVESANGLTYVNILDASLTLNSDDGTDSARITVSPTGIQLDSTDGTASTQILHSKMDFGINTTDGLHYSSALEVSPTYSGIGVNNLDTGDSAGINIIDTNLDLSTTGVAIVTYNGIEIATVNNILTKQLTGLSISGGSVTSADNILQAIGKLQNQVAGVLGGAIGQGVWNASTNTPSLTSSVGTDGHYYIVSVAGSTNLNGITDWKVGDWAWYTNGQWWKVDNTDAVSSVNGLTGAVSMTTDNVAEGSSNLYYTSARFNTAFSAKSTTDLTEGSNLYFTDARARTAAVENDLTASTTIAPSKTAVNNALLLKADKEILYRSIADSSVLTGTTSTTIMGSYMVPANTVGPGNILRIIGHLSKTGVAGSQSTKIYINTSNTLTGATQVALQTNNATATFAVIERNLRIFSATDTRTLNNVSFSSDTPGSFTSGVETSRNINWTVNQYIMITSELANTGDSSKLTTMEVYKR